MVEFSDDAKKLLKSFIGYRYEDASEFGIYNAQNAKAVIRFELQELNNWDMLSEIAHRLGTKQTLQAIFNEIDKRFGPNAVAIWFATRRGVKWYKQPGSGAPSRYNIPRNALMITDLGEDGQLFIIPRSDWVSMR